MKHPRHQVLIKFLLLCFVLFSYFIYLTYKYDLLTGGVAALITWSFFVLCSLYAYCRCWFPVRFSYQNFIWYSHGNVRNSSLGCCHLNQYFFLNIFQRILWNHFRYPINESHINDAFSILDCYFSIRYRHLPFYSFRWWIAGRTTP